MAGAGGTVEHFEAAVAGEGTGFVVRVDEDGPHEDDVAAGIGGEGGEEVDAGFDGFVHDLGGFEDGVGGGEDARTLGEEDLFDRVLLIVKFSDVAGRDFTALQASESGLGSAAAGGGGRVAGAEDVAGDTRAGDTDVRAVKDEDGAIGGDMVGEGTHAGEAGEGEAVQAAHLEGAEHFVGSFGVFDEVEVIRADTVSGHELAGFEAEPAGEEGQHPVDGVARRESFGVKLADGGEVGFVIRHKLHEDVVFGLERGREGGFAEHFEEVDFDGTAQGGDGDVVGAAFEGVFGGFADFVHRVEYPGDEGAGGDIDPDEGFAEFMEFLEEAEGGQDDEEPDEEVVEGGELAGIGEVFDALALALRVGEGGEQALEFEETELGGGREGDGGAEVLGLEMKQVGGTVFAGEDVGEFRGVQMRS